jgi:hypothetical protein
MATAKRRLKPMTRADAEDSCDFETPDESRGPDYRPYERSCKWAQCAYAYSLHYKDIEGAAVKLGRTDGRAGGEQPANRKRVASPCGPAGSKPGQISGRVVGTAATP